MPAKLSALLACAWLAAAGASAQPFGPFDFAPPPGRLGVQLQPMTPELRAFLGAPEDRGVLVVRVNEGSAADQAGVKVGDVIVAVAGQAAHDISDVIGTVFRAEENAKVRLEIVRDKKSKELSAVLTGKPDERFSGGDFHRFMPRMGPELEQRMDELERRLQELEKKLEDSLRKAPERAT